MSQFILPSRATDANNNPLSGALLYFYLTGTTTLTDVFADGDLATPHSNPVVANAGGQFAPIYTDPSVEYRAVLKTALGSTIDEFDPYWGSSTNAEQVAFTDDGDGSTETTVEDFLRRINQKASGNFYTESGAKIQRFADRVFVGDAINNLGTNDVTQPDWLTTFQLARGRDFGLIQGTQMVVTNSGETIDPSIAFLGASQNGTLGLGYNAIGVTGIGISNNLGVGGGMAWGGYFEGYRQGTASRGGYAIEADIINMVSVVTIDPYVQENNQTVAIQIASGGEYGSGVLSASAYINFQNNGADAIAGIICGSDSLHFDVTTGLADAMQLARNQGFAWFTATGVRSSSIYSTASTISNASKLELGESSVNVRNQASNKLIFAIVNSGVATVNYPKVQPAGAGVPVQFMADGDDTNIGLKLVPKGTGRVGIPVGNVPNFADDAAAAAGGVTVGEIYRNGSILMLRIA